MNTDSVHTIAVFRALKIGDMVCAVPFFRALRKEFPHAHIALIGLPWAEGFVQRYRTYIDELIRFPGYPGLPEQDFNAPLFPSFLAALKRRHFDLLFQLQGSGTVVNPLMHAFGAKHLIGYAPPDNGQMSQTEQLYPYPDHLHETMRCLHLLEHAGIATHGTFLEFPLTAEELKISRVLKAYHMLVGERYIVLHPGASTAVKRIPPAVFGAVGQAFYHEGFDILVTGSKNERIVCHTVMKYLPPRAVNLCGSTTLGVLGAVIKQARLVISNDTSVSHIASALKTKSVILYTALSDVRRWSPRNAVLHKALTPPHSSNAEEIVAVGNMVMRENPVTFRSLRRGRAVFNA